MPFHILFAFQRYVLKIIYCIVMFRYLSDNGFIWQFESLQQETLNSVHVYLQDFLNHCRRPISIVYWINTIIISENNAQVIFLQFQQGHDRN